MKVVGIISGTSFDAVETAAADLRLEDDVVVLQPLGVARRPLRSGVAGCGGRSVTPRRHERGGGLHARHAPGACVRGGRGRCRASVLWRASGSRRLSRADYLNWVEGERALGTLQLGQPAWIAARTGSPVVSDLRSRDIAEGGHGAPLVSIFDILLLGSGERRRAALNLGGIANLTVLPGGDTGDPAFAFDVGPADALLDAAVDYLTGGSETYDPMAGRQRGAGSTMAYSVRYWRSPTTGWGHPSPPERSSSTCLTSWSASRLWGISRLTTWWRPSRR